MCHREVQEEDINVRVLLLPPFPEDAPPFMKSAVDLFSRFGSVAVDLVRLSAAANHFVRLFITSCEEDVRVLLPAMFRGVIFINRTRRNWACVHYCKELRNQIGAGNIRINPPHEAEMEDEDEVHIHALGDVDIRIAEEGSPHPPMWNYLGSKIDRFRRMLRMP
ncbi:hypothetical protein BDQ12DRAFT_612820 [Crucibulum laeve]|uniref:Uncharacterized protein n=1 Tax=Crucibulum laeve TaxID=68775 RepID=A0A5C3LPS2_9AGAR|nr:hypothetical protein BDQ12DRAFT_612820 [Crucibulum laeve]